MSDEGDIQCGVIPCLFATFFQTVYAIADATLSSFQVVVFGPEDFSGPMTLTYQTNALKDNTVCFMEDNLASVGTPTVTLVGGTLTVIIPDFNAAFGSPTGVSVKCVNLEFPTPPKACCNTNNQLKGRGEVCRKATSFCHEDACCDGVNADCPANGNSPTGIKCPWSPSLRHQPYATRMDVAKPSTTVPAGPALAVQPNGYDWPWCEGKCIDGRCALRWDHPACCYASHGHHHDGSIEEAKPGTEYAQADNFGHWVNHDLYCWGNV